MSRMRPLPKAVGIALAVCVLTGLAVALLPLESRAQQAAIRFVHDPDPAPELKAKDLDGKKLSIEAFKGTGVLLSF